MRVPSGAHPHRRTPSDLASPNPRFAPKGIILARKQRGSWRRPVRSVFGLDDPPIMSAPRTESVLFEEHSGKLYVSMNTGDAFWIPAFRSILSALIAGEEEIDIRQCALNANQILAALTLELARVQLEQAGFSPPAFSLAGDLDLQETDLG